VGDTQGERKRSHRCICENERVLQKKKTGGEIDRYNNRLTVGGIDTQKTLVKGSSPEIKDVKATEKKEKRESRLGKKGDIVTRKPAIERKGT